MKLACLLIMVFSLSLFAQEEKGRVIYRYKKYQEFDLEALGVAGDQGSPGDLSVDRRRGNRLKNQLPLRKNFNPEIRRSVEITR